MTLYICILIRCELRCKIEICHFVHWFWQPFVMRQLSQFFNKYHAVKSADNVVVALSSFLLWLTHFILRISVIVTSWTPMIYLFPINSVLPLCYKLLLQELHTRLDSSLTTNSEVASILVELLLANNLVPSRKNSVVKVNLISFFFQHAATTCIGLIFFLL